MAAGEAVVANNSPVFHARTAFTTGKQSGEDKPVDAEEPAAKKAKVAERPQPPTTIPESWRSRTSSSIGAAAPAAGRGAKKEVSK